VGSPFDGTDVGATRTVASWVSKKSPIVWTKFSTPMRQSRAVRDVREQNAAHHERGGH
jgi:hypothetical protein